MRRPDDDRLRLKRAGKVPGRARATSVAEISPGELDRLRSGARALGVPLEEDAIAAFDRFLRELRLWAPRTNLIAKGDLPLVVERHVLDSLAAVPILRRLAARPSFIDVGSGAGFPGIPLAIALRPSRALLVEPRQRRASFLRSVGRAIPEIAIEIGNLRLEDLTVPEAQRFDALVSRAALPIDDLLASGAQLLRPGGLVVVYRGARAGELGSVQMARQQSSRGALFEPSGGIGYRIPAISNELRLEVWRRTAVPRETSP